MSYAPATDFLALLRQTSGGMRSARVPGLDYLVAGLARANMFLLWVGAIAPTRNQATTVWLQPALQSWSAEGTVYLWNAAVGAYVPATPALWAALLGGTSSGSGYVFQSIAGSAGVVGVTTTLLAVQRAAPTVTALTLPALASRSGKPLQIVDWSSGVSSHAVTLTTPDGATIMQQASWELVSSAVQLSGATLYPSSDLNGWVIAP